MIEPDDTPRDYSDLCNAERASLMRSVVQHFITEHQYDFGEEADVALWKLYSIVVDGGEYDA